MWHDICQCPDSSLYLRRGVNRGQQIRRLMRANFFYKIRHSADIFAKTRILSTVRVVLLVKSADLKNNFIT